MKKTTLFLLFTFSFLINNAQTINTDSLANYSSAVIVRVYEVASKVNLTIAEQISLANLFTEEETTIANLILANAASESIEANRAVYKYRFSHILPSQKANDYYKVTASIKANKVAKLNASFLQHKYSMNNTMKQYFNDMFGWKEQLIEENFLRYSDTAIIDSNIYNIIQSYDTLIEKYIHLAHSQALINEKVDFIKSINTNISATKIQNLQNTYSNLSLQYPNLSLIDHFNQAFNYNFNQISDTPYYIALYQNQILLNSYFSSKNAIAGYIKQYQIADTGIQKLKPIISAREYEIAVINKLYPDYTPFKDSIIDSIRNKYYVDIDRIISRYSISQVPSQFDLAINYATHLNLSNEQIEALASKAEEYRVLRNQFRQHDPAGDYENKEFESRYISSIITTEQYTNLLTIKFQSISEDIAKKDWKYLQELSLSQNYVEAETVLALKNYHLALFIAYHRNANNKELQFTSVANIIELMPEAMHELINNWSYRSPYQYNPDIFFQW